MGGIILRRMENTPDSANLPWFEPLRRYVPLVVWIVVVMTMLLIPLKIIGYGYLPGDDALRSAGKALSGKTWPEILVLNDVYKIDHEFGWSMLLSKVHTLWNLDADGVLIFSVVSLFFLVSFAAVPWLRYPEAWLVILTLSMIAALMPFRFLFGRPFIMTIAALLALLFLWKKYGSAPPKAWMAAFITLVIGASVYFHGTWYLWVLPIAAFFLARQFWWGFAVGCCWVAGVLMGSALTGHLIDYPLQAIKIVQLATGKHMTQSTLVGEMQPSNGDMWALWGLGALLLLRRLASLNATPFLRDPAFWLVCLSWVLGFKVGRFWIDWGWPALMVLVAGDLQLLFESRIIYDSLQRLALACGIALVTFMAITADVGSRWTANLTQQYLTTDNPDLKGWMPDKGGILYSADMTIFYQTFYKNPHGDWRYILGFEATLMPAEDFEVYHSALWNFGDAKAYKPWLLKMTPADRLVIRGGRGSAPAIPQLDWNYGVSGIWVGRLPRPQGDDAPATIAATKSMDTLTNSPASTNSAK